MHADSGQQPRGGPLDGGATPWWLDDLLRSAAAVVTGAATAGVPAAEPRRPPAGTRGDYATALALRIAGAVGLPADELAADIAAELRSTPHVVSADVEGRGFVNLTLTPRARVSLVRAARAPGYLTGDRPAQSPPLAGGRTAVEWGLSALHTAETLSRARAWARDDARRRMLLATGAGEEESGGCPASGGPGAGGPPPSRGRTGSEENGAEEVTWRDPCIDTPPGMSEAARLLGVVGEANARIAFCRSVPERPRPGEVTGPDLPALPTAEEPGDWERLTAANPGFAVRYAHAHAVSTRGWAARVGFAPPGPALSARPRAGACEFGDDAVAALDEPRAAALLGCLFDGPGVLSAAAERRQPHILVRYLEGVAAAYHEWRESCTAVPTSPATDAAEREVVGARLELCAAVAGVLGTGLSLLGVPAPTLL
ncbi:DALR anticodon-binding domain-containing protein [Halostreptopolyspora alba]|uniref:arginine--tRNA ligase n=1 Tax=Halostreptopolyspora alba TaxID=2487137 RepID=A0A3N0E9Q1_9ACTN|nr:hypothetical protein EFW17_11680 [Nocardiopsaceae bacterium YIM 96095]